ncbi:MAG TPA: zf-HC2 domain-containing protein [Bryobacteraceae bacterium]|nr:zf-HC2 domain-containing protein [Bryobacteraceae bacterium]
MNCADFEILLCDYLDGTLDQARRSEIEQHMQTCASCAELAADVRSAMGLVERAAAVEPPAELLTRILHIIPGNNAAGKKSWWRRRWIEPILQPRYAMGMAMTVLSFSMLARFAGIEPRQLKPSDLDPVKIWMAVDDRAHRAWDKTVKYYENLRLVIEVQSRLKEWTEQDSSAPADKNSGANQTKGAPGNSSPGRGERR